MGLMGGVSCVCILVYCREKNDVENKKHDIEVDRVMDEEEDMLRNNTQYRGRMGTQMRIGLDLDEDVIV